MLPHHAESIEIMRRHFEGEPGVLGLILGGSVARGNERPDSDLDALVVVTPARHAELEAAGRLSECIWGKCTYEGGYFDIKHFTADYLRAAALRGSDPTRNSFLGARVLFGPAGLDLPGLVGRIGQYPVADKERRIRLFYSIFLLSSGYFFECALKDRSEYFLRRAAADAVYGGLRMLYAKNEVFFPCHRRMVAEADKLPDKPADLAALAEALCAEPTPAARDAFVAAVKGHPGWNLDFSRYDPHLSVYVKAMEQSWQNSEDNVFEL